MKFDDPQVKKEMIAERYRKEQELTRQVAIDNSEYKNTVLELYSGTGGLTKLYKSYFNEVITNDINKNSEAVNNLSAMEFINRILPNSGHKFDIVDFDCYGSPAEEIKKFFEIRERKDCPLIVTLSDGLGLWMKRTRRTDLLKKRYLLDDFAFDERHPWRKHIDLIDHMMQKIAEKYDMQVTKLIAVQTKHMNYVLGTWKFI